MDGIHCSTLFSIKILSNIRFIHRVKPGMGREVGRINILTRTTTSFKYMIDLSCSIFLQLIL